jgi:hypothetical protein
VRFLEVSLETLGNREHRLLRTKKKNAVTLRT